MNLKTAIIFSSALFLSACVSNGSLVVGAQEDLTDFVESDKTGFVYVFTVTKEEEGLGTVTRLAEEYGIEILGYNTHKPDGKNKIPLTEQPNYEYQGAISKNAISYIENGEVVKEIKVDVDIPDFEDQFKVFLESIK